MGKIVRTICRSCHGGCGVLAEVENGVVVSIKGDKDCPINRGSLCIKGRLSHKIAHDENRLKYPMKRTKGGWKRISWDEAYDEITDRLSEVREKFGAESLVMGYGTGRDNESFIYRFANLFGTPNVLTAGHMCYGPRIVTGISMCGNLPVVDYEGRPACVVVWGCNPVISNPDEYKGFYLLESLKQGTKLIVVDPRRTWLSERADLWLPVRPGTDSALAWGMVKVIVKKKLYDEEFVEKYVHGWDEFVKRAETYSMDWIEKTTGVDRSLIEKAARMYAGTKPAGIHWGVALEQTRDCTNNIRLLISLMAITGNLDAPGGNVFYPNPPIINASKFGAHKLLPEEQRKKRLGGDRFRLADMIGVINPRAVWEAVLYEKPYPVKAIFLLSTNPVLTRANAKMVKEALEKVEFLVVSDIFMTPTALHADIVLPSAHWLEVDYVADLWKRHGYVLARVKATQIGESKSDYEVLNELGKRLTDSKMWWPTVKDALDYILSPSGLTFEEFKERRYLRGPVRFRKYLEKGFRTPTGKVELYSTVFEKLGYDPLPGYLGPYEGPEETPELKEKYPYVLITGARIPYFFHTEFRPVKALRSRHPDPIVEINPKLAQEKGIKDGDWVEISSPRGRCRQRAKVTDVVPYHIISAQHAWWFPEESQESFFAWDRSNINLLTENGFSSCDQAMGATSLRTMLCNIKKVG